jgi:hypothetical protein
VAPRAGKTTPTAAQRSVPGSVNGTRQPQHRLPVNSNGPLTLTNHTATPAVTGPAAWENGRDAVESPSGPPPLAGATARDVHPTGQDCGC